MKILKNKYYILFIISVLLIIFIAPFASEHPDGLEYVAQSKGFIEYGELNPTYWKFSIMPDYAIPNMDNDILSTILSGLIGLILTIATSFFVFIFYKKKHN